MVYEDMKTLVLSPSTPFLLKKEVLKALFTIFIQEIEYELNSNFSLAEMNDILLNIIIRDLAAFSKNIEGLVDVNA